MSDRVRPSSLVLTIRQVRGGSGWGAKLERSEAVNVNGQHEDKFEATKSLQPRPGQDMRAKGRTAVTACPGGYVTRRASNGTTCMCFLGWLLFRSRQRKGKQPRGPKGLKRTIDGCMLLRYEEECFKAWIRATVLHAALVRTWHRFPDQHSRIQGLSSRPHCRNKEKQQVR